MLLRIVLFTVWILSGSAVLVSQVSEAQLERWLKRFPEADANGDGKLTVEEAEVYRQAARSQTPDTGSSEPQALPEARTLNINPGWDTSDFPDYAVYKKSASEIMEIYMSGPKARSAPAQTDAMSFPLPSDGGMRIVGVGHSFMAPAYKTLPLITEAAGFEQPMCLHTGGGVTGSARYKWEQENGIFQFDGKPVPKLLASIANADWEAMLWGVYYEDRPEFYECWINFCTEYHPDMKFYLQDGWPQLYQLDELLDVTTIPENEDFLSEKVVRELRNWKRDEFIEMGKDLRKRTTPNFFIIPTNDAMSEAARLYVRGELPGVEGFHRLIGGKERSIWRDKIGHLAPGFDRLEGYVFYATLYGKSPELIEKPVQFAGDSDYPSKELDKVFRKIAWKAVTGHPLSGVKDKNKNLIGDHLE